MLYLSEGGSWGPRDLVDSIDGYADHRRQGHGETDGQRPAGIHVVVVGDGLVLDDCEDEDELQGQKKQKMSVCGLRHFQQVVENMTSGQKLWKMYV